MTCKITRWYFCYFNVFVASWCAMAALVSSEQVHAQLSDEGFNLPFTMADIVPYAGTGMTAVDRWAAEEVEVVGLDNGVMPIDGVVGDQMIKMFDDGSTYTELKQRVGSVGLFSDAQVDSGTVEALYFACFNLPANSPAGASAEIEIQFLGENLAPIGAPVSLSSDPLDNDPETWEHIELSGVPVPVGARGAEAIVRYDIASLTHPTGAFVPAYVDKTHLEFSAVPEPASLILALCSGSLILGGRKARR